MEDAAPESLHPGDESELDAMRAALAAPHAGGDELPDDDGDDDLESGPLDDADYAVDEELAAEVDFVAGELEQAMTQMPLRDGGDQRKLDVAAFIACKTQLERSGSRGSGSQRLWQAAGPDTGALPSHGEPHQLSYYGLGSAICQARPSACHRRARRCNSVGDQLS